MPPRPHLQRRMNPTLFHSCTRAPHRCGCALPIRRPQKTSPRRRRCCWQPCPCPARPDSFDLVSPFLASLRRAQASQLSSSQLALHVSYALIVDLTFFTFTRNTSRHDPHKKRH
ncbi:hypothetical protein K461DRAFT_107510 [Myriangium duriaei CBS 260.36]|uniref:Uncharacterized protein n=1 Tax=Myriangium duriaei CBS 260.36 TaxID=1168546 RepID=A0A9P4J5P8_9PEZI|nr:hypothetical protein K461DRAFT_107510 [Myriangium duriaei CBS 260.36]